MDRVLNLRFTSYFNFSYELISQQLLIVRLRFSTWLTSENKCFELFSQLSRIGVFKFYFAWVSKLGFSFPSF